MKKYDDVPGAVWIAASIMIYNTYITDTKDNDIDIGSFLLKQSDIKKEAEKISIQNN